MLQSKKSPIVQYAALNIFYLSEHFDMSKLSNHLSSSFLDAEGSSILSDPPAEDSSREMRQVLSELLSCNAVIPSKNRVKCDDHRPVEKSEN